MPPTPWRRSTGGLTDHRKHSGQRVQLAEEEQAWGEEGSCGSHCALVSRHSHHIRVAAPDTGPTRNLLGKEEPLTPLPGRTLQLHPLPVGAAAFNPQQQSKALPAWGL